MLGAALAGGYLISISSSPLLLVVAVALIAIAIVTLVKIEWAFAILLASTLLSPEEGLFETYRRLATLRLEDFLLFVVFFVWLARRAFEKEQALIEWTPLNRAIIIYSGIYAISTLKGIIVGNLRPLSAILFLLKYLEYFFLYFMVVSHIKNLRHVGWFVVIILAVGGVTAALSYQDIGQVYRITGPVGRPTGGEPATFAGYYVLVYSVIFGFMFSLRSILLKVALGGLAVLMFPPFLFTLSRGSFVAFVAMFLSLFVFIRRGRWLLLGITLALVLAAVNFLPLAVIQRVTFTFNPMYTDEITVLGFPITLEPSTLHRIEIYAEAYEYYFQHFPILGGGASFMAVADAQLARLMVEVGVLGIAAFGFLMWRIFWVGWQVRNRSVTPLGQGLAIGMLAGTVGLLFHAIAASTFILIRLMEAYWFLLALLVLVLPLEARLAGTEPSVEKVS